MKNTNNQNINTNQVRKTRRGTSEIPKKQVKKGTSVGGKGLLIGIGIFFFLVIGLVFIFFFYLTSHPNAAKSFGIKAITVQSVSFIFASLLFGSLFVLFLVLGLTYLYRLLYKPTEKVKNLIGTIIIFILGILNIVLGLIVFYRIKSIPTNNVIKTTDVLIANANFANEKGEIKYIPLYQNKYPLIAPIKISFQFNKRIFDRIDYPRLIQKEGNINLKKFILDCGNGQKIEYSANYKFAQDKWCLYLKKGKYTVRLSLIYSTANANSKVYTFNEKEINITSALVFKSPIKVKNGEIIGGEIGDRVKIDLTQVPIDLKLKGNAIDIDFEGNGNFVKSKGLASYIYNSDGLYNILFKIPERQTYPIYTFPLRIIYSDKPSCKIIKKNKGNKYMFLVSINPYHSPIKKVYYKLKDISDYSLVKQGIGKNFSQKLKNGKDYTLIWYLEASNRKKGSCSLDILLASQINYEINFQIKDSNNKINLSGDTIYVHSFPQSYKIEASVKPNSEFLDKGFDVDNDGEIDISDSSYIVNIKNNQDKAITYIVKDEKGNTYKKKINFKIKLKPIQAVLFAKPRKGQAPLIVKLDASASKVNIEDDEIVYFNWDFGDGENMSETRQGIIEHNYKKPGTYKAKVVVITDKNYKDEAIQLIRVYRPINTATIEFPDNIAGQVVEGEPLKIKVYTNGLIKTINWDFGDGKTFSCSGRECSSITHSYEKKGIYHIEAKIIYADGSPTVVTRKTVSVIKQ